MTRIHNSSPRSLSLRILGVIGIIFGLSFGVQGILLIFKGGTWFYGIAGIMTVLASVLIYFEKWQGVALYLGVCVYAIFWAFYEVYPMDVWFWPLIPRLFSFAVALFFVLLFSRKIPAIDGSKPVSAGTKFGALCVFFGILFTLVAMFFPHGVVRNEFTVTNGAAVNKATKNADGEWRHYGNTTMGTRFGTSMQINRENIKNLVPAWVYHTGSVGTGDGLEQNTPIYAKGRLFACTSRNQIHAIDAKTGERLWMFDPISDAKFLKRCRAIAYYEPPAHTPPIDNCEDRIVFATLMAELIEVDAQTGELCHGFGVNGRVDLRAGLGEHDPAFYSVTSGPTVAKDVIVMGASIADNIDVDAPSGVIRAFDVMTGEMHWAWDVGRPNEKGMPPDGEVFTEGTPNVWSIPSFDEALGLVYLPTGNASPDWFGAYRKDYDERYSSSVVALDIATGDVAWSFQTVHHDLWDLDVPAQPALYDLIDEAGARVPALVQLTKRGEIFVLNRETGAPISRVEALPVAQNGVDGEEKIKLSATQPFSVEMPRIGLGELDETKMWGATPIDQVNCRLRFHQYRNAGNEFTPPGTDPFINAPGSFGGFNWGSAAIDEVRGIAFAVDMRLPSTRQLLPRAEYQGDGGVSSPGTEILPMRGTPYVVKRGLLSSFLGLPCNQPPYGTISAIDLNKKTLLWQRPVGSLQDLDFVPLHTGLDIPIGMPAYAGAMATAGGLVFYAGGMDRQLRAYDAETGESLAEFSLPFGASATPMSFSDENGKQYIVIFAGGSAYSSEEARGDTIIAFALPNS